MDKLAFLLEGLLCVFGEIDTAQGGGKNIESKMESRHFAIITEPGGESNVKVGPLSLFISFKLSQS